MAFEAFLQQQQRARPSARGRRITYMVSVAIHAAAVLAAVAYSFWHVEELTPQAVTVTFMTAAAAPPPPPPPSPLGGGAAVPKPKAATRPKADSTPKVIQPVVQPKVDSVVQPAEPPKEAPKEIAKGNTPAADAPPGAGTSAGVKGGVEGGTKGGTVAGIAGGTVGGTATQQVAVRAPRILAPDLARLQITFRPEPEFPVDLRRPGANYKVGVKVCVSPTAGISSLALIRRAHPILDSNSLDASKRLRFKPLVGPNGTPIPFCYVQIWEFVAE